MPESGGNAKMAIPDDIRHLKDFPHYDTSLHDNPKFRQHLNAWASKTEKLFTVLDALANSFTEFHTAGVQQHEAATSIMSGLQRMSELLENTSPTITEPLNKFTESLNNMWYYYETFLGQTQMLVVDPIRKMAKQFSILKGIYEELQQYRKEFIQAADQMCACRHVSKLNDSQQFQQLAETCYSAQRTYQLVLSKYLTCLREAHTTDMMSMLRRLLEHFLSIYSYHNYCAGQMKDLEGYLNDLFSMTKEWMLFYTEEMETWNELQRHVKKIVTTDHIHQVESLPTGASSKVVHKVKSSKKIGPYGTPTSAAVPITRVASDQTFLIASSVPVQPTEPIRIDSPVIPQKLLPLESPVSTPKMTTLRGFSTPIFPESEIQVKKPEFYQRLKLLRSNSDADLLSTETPVNDGVVQLSNDTELHETDTLRRRSQSIDELILSGSEEDKEASLNTAAKKIEEALGDRKMTKSGKPLLAILNNLRRKDSKERSKNKRRKRMTSLDETERSRSGSTTPVESPSLENSPFNNRKKHSLLKKARNSLTVFRHDGDTEDVESFEGRASAEGGSSISSGEQLSDTVCDVTPVVTSKRSSDGSLQSPPSPSVVPISPRPKDVNFQQLINPTPSSWTKSGYLMWRMKLPNNTYAWTYMYCVVDKECGQLMVQEQSLPEPRPLEDLMLCTTKPGTPDFIDRNFCFRVISPSSEHLFQALGETDMLAWISAIQESIEHAIKHGDTGSRAREKKSKEEEMGGELVPNAMKLILKVPGNKQCADCSSTDVQWASINLGIVLCIECSGVHRALGVHVSKVRSLNLDKWNQSNVKFMQSQGNTKSNAYYEARLGKTGTHSDIHKPPANAAKSERMQFVQLKYVTLAFVPELTAH